MEKSLEKIKQELSLKRKHNEEILKQLKEQSLIYKKEKEKQKKYFLNKTSTFLNKKRKKPINDDILPEEKNNKNISNDIINSYEDYDEYYEDFMNNSMIGNRTFNNLNFCRPERFSFQYKKKKLSIKSEQEFTIKKTLKPTSISNKIQVSFEKNKNNISNRINSSNNIGLFSEKPSINNNSNKITDKEISFFDINNNDKDNNDIKKNGGLFNTDNNNNGNNEKKLFTSNIKSFINKEEKKDEIKDKDEVKKENAPLFGDISRFNNSEEKKVTLFGAPTTTNINFTAEKEKQKENIIKSSSELTVIKDENKESTNNFAPHKIDDDDIIINKEEKKEKEKEKLNIGSIFSQPKIETKTVEEKTEINKTDNNKKENLFSGNLFNLQEKKRK